MKTNLSPSGPLQRRLDDWRCRRTVRRWKRSRRKTARHSRLAARVRSLPYWHEIGQFLYQIGFLLEYRIILTARGLLWLLAACAHVLRDLLAMLTRPLLALLPEPQAQSTGRAAQLGRTAGRAAVVLAAAGCVLLVRTWLGRPYLLQVEVDGQVIGYIQNEQVLDAAQAVVHERIENAREVSLAAGRGWDEEAIQVDPGYRLAVTFARPMTQTQLVNALLQASGGTLQQATAVYVDGALQMVTGEGDHLRSYLQSLLAPHADVYDPDQRVEFRGQVQLTDGLFFADSVLPMSEVIRQLNEAEDQPLQICTIERRTYTEAIPYPTYTEESAAYEYGETVQLQAGEDGLQEVTQDTVFVDGAATEVRTIAVETLREPVTEHLVTGTQLQDSMYGEIGGQEFVWPVPQYRQISRWMGGGHTGTDIAAPEGTPIIASAAGTVVTAYYWNGIRTQGDYNSYGNYVEIDHENGYRTLYGHMIRFVVTQGEHVEQGQLIGYVGNTGYSLGAHCHFEMFGPNGRFSARQVFPTMARLNY